MHMATLLRRVSACCFRTHSDPPHSEPNENSRLISVTDEPTATPPPGVHPAGHRNIRDRLGSIVRSKEGKMVNVAVKLPFNIQGQDLSPHHGSSSRSTRTPSANQSRPPIYPRHGENSNQASRRPSASPVPSVRSSVHPQAIDDEEEVIQPVLNIKLVKDTDRKVKTRGRKGADKGGASGSDGGNESNAHGSSTDPSPPPPPSSKTPFKIHDDAALSMSWGD